MTEETATLALVANHHSVDSTKKPCDIGEIAELRPEEDNEKSTTLQQQNTELNCSGRKKCSPFIENDDFSLVTKHALKHACNCSFCTGGYECATCAQLYKSKFEFYEHISEHVLSSDSYTSKDNRDGKHDFQANSGNGPFRTIEDVSNKCNVVKPSFGCDSCGKTYKWRKTLVSHMKIHENSCTICGKNLRKPFLKSHLRKAHGVGLKEWLSEKPFECDFCQKRLISRKSLQIHILSHLGVTKITLKCEKCTTIFASQSWFDRHQCKKHINSSAFTCDTCGKIFRQKSNLTTHIKTHTGEKTYHCQICQKGFYFNYAYLEHFATHKIVKSFQCGICNKGLSTKKSLQKHANTHRNGKPYVCDRCNSPFRHKSSLGRHRRLTINCMKTDIKAKKTYSCEVCSKEFFSLGAFKNHSYSHGNMPYLCGYCKVDFRTEKAVRTHVFQTHVGMCKTCDFCQQAFICDEDLKQHISIHFVSSPFVE